MLMGIYVILMIIMIALFLTAFFTHQEILWVVALVLSGVLMFSSWGIETYTYEYNSTIELMQPTIVTDNYPYMAGINMIFFGLGLVLFLFDIWEKYGQTLIKGKG